MPEYVVAGKHRVFGQEPGSRFDRDIPEVQERHLLESGALKRADAKSVPTQIDADSEGADDPTTPRR